VRDVRSYGGLLMKDLFPNGISDGVLENGRGVSGSCGKQTLDLAFGA